jgi:hypothetical protein
MDGFTDWLDHITDDRGLFSLSVCNEAVVPRWIYASYRWRHGVVLCTRIFTLGNAPVLSAYRILRPIQIVFEYQFVVSFACFEAALCAVKKMYNKQTSIKMVTAMTL